MVHADGEKESLLGQEASLPPLARAGAGQRRRSCPARVGHAFIRLVFALMAVVGMLNMLSWTPLARYAPSGLLPSGRHDHGANGLHRGQHAAHIHHSQHHEPHGRRPVFDVIDCFDISAKHAAVNFSVTLPHPGAPVHLMHGLAQSDVSIQPDKSVGKPEHPSDSIHYPPPHRRPSRGPPHAPPHTPPSHRPHPDPPMHGHPQIIMIGTRRQSISDEHHTIITSESFDERKDDQKKAHVFICSLKMPFGQIGLGLFHDEPRRNGGHHDPIPSPEESKPFPPVALEVRLPAGAPFAVTGGFGFATRFPWGMRHGCHGPNGPHGNRDAGHPVHEAVHNLQSAQPAEDGEKHAHLLVVVTKVIKKIGCAGRRIISSKPKTIN